MKTSVYAFPNGLETLLPNGQPNPAAQPVLGILAQFNGGEHGLIRSRMKPGTVGVWRRRDYLFLPLRYEAIFSCVAFAFRSAGVVWRQGDFSARSINCLLDVRPRFVSLGSSPRLRFDFMVAGLKPKYSDSSSSVSISGILSHINTLLGRCGGSVRNFTANSRFPMTSSVGFPQKVYVPRPFARCA